MLTDKRALVSGSSSGIGEAVARRLAEEGASVVIHGRNEAQIERVATDVIAAGRGRIISRAAFITGATLRVDVEVRRR